MLFSDAQAQSAGERAVIGAEDIKPLQIGDTIPEALWNLPLQVVNHTDGKRRIKLADFKGKALLLDFMSTGCKACIEALPGMEKTISVYGNDVVLLPITNEGRDRMLRFKPDNDYLRNSELTYVVEDRVLRKAFPHSFISHVVWIDVQGVVRGFTRTNHMTESTLGDLLDGNTFGWPVKSETTSYFHQPIMQGNNKLEEMPNNTGQKFHYAAITGYIDGIGSYYPTSRDTLEGVERISLRNISLLDFGLIASGLGLFKRGNILNQDHTEWKVANVHRYAYELYEGDELTKDQWYQRYAISYERTVPLGMRMEDKQRILMDDLKSFMEISCERRGGELLFFELNLDKR
ncbi:hypothetical protein C4F40_14395 [Sphingobacterium sp. Ka21]|uniref:Thioredoxin domain-containing protein n=1 Tax=Sphingobacterium pedocola TaxID=2082722 RepID=A0ABR9T9E6_9SPHI|nr:hypothetical protein [Sphingobacterium pedocola]